MATEKLGIGDAIAAFSIAYRGEGEGRLSGGASDDTIYGGGGMGRLIGEADLIY
jgi:Ca2+-binding RTX toxin-like protein